MHSSVLAEATFTLTTTIPPHDRFRRLNRLSLFAKESFLIFRKLDSQSSCSRGRAERALFVIVQSALAWLLIGQKGFRAQCYDIESWAKRQKSMLSSMAERKQQRMSRTAVLKLVRTFDYLRAALVLGGFGWTSAYAASLSHFSALALFHSYGAAA